MQNVSDMNTCSCVHCAVIEDVIIVAIIQTSEITRREMWIEKYVIFPEQ